MINSKYSRKKNNIFKIQIKINKKLPWTEVDFSKSQYKHEAIPKSNVFNI